MIWLIESDVMSCINYEVSSINIVTLHNHFEYFWLMNCSFFHKVNNLILYHDRMINIVIHLNLDFIFKLPSFIQKISIINWIFEILIIFSQKIHFINMTPRVKSIHHWILCDKSYILPSSQQE